MTGPAPEPIDFNAAFGKALLEHFFQPVPSGGTNPTTGQPYYAASGVSVLAQQLYTAQANEIKDAVWSQIDLDDFALKVAEKVVADLTREPSRNFYSVDRNVHREKLVERVLEIVAQQLGQRVVDQLDLQLGPKQLETTGETS